MEWGMEEVVEKEKERKERAVPPTPRIRKYRSRRHTVPILMTPRRLRFQLGRSTPPPLIRRRKVKSRLAQKDDDEWIPSSPTKARLPRPDLSALLSNEALPPEGPICPGAPRHAYLVAPRRHMLLPTSLGLAKEE